MLQAEIERLFEEKPEKYTEEHFRLFQRFKDALNQGRVRAAEPDPSSPSGWRVNPENLARIERVLKELGLLEARGVHAAS